MPKERGNIEDDPIIQGYLEASGVGKSSEQTDDTSSQDGTGDVNTDQQTQQQAQPQGQGQVDPKQDSGSGQPNGQPKQVDPKASGQNPDPAKDQLRAGDIRTPDGQVVRAGAERRHYENMRIAREQATAADAKVKAHEQTITQLQTQVQSNQAALTAIGASNPQEVSDSLRLMKDLRSNPTGTLQTLIAELAASGVDLSGVVSGLDMKALSAMLDQRLPQQQQQQQVDPAKEVEEEARTFATAHPDALMHQDVIIGLASKNPNMSLETIYWELRQQVVNNGYDWSQPLGPQYHARQGQQQQQQRPMPNGNGGSVDHVPVQDVMKKATAGDDDSIDSIVRAALKETGYRNG